MWWSSRLVRLRRGCSLRLEGGRLAGRGHGEGDDDSDLDRAGDRERLEGRVPENQRAGDEDVEQPRGEQHLPAQRLNLVVAKAWKGPPNRQLQPAEQQHFEPEER